MTFLLIFFRILHFAFLLPYFKFITYHRNYPRKRKSSCKKIVVLDIVRRNNVFPVRSFYFVVRYHDKVDAVINVKNRKRYQVAEIPNFTHGNIILERNVHFVVIRQPRVVAAAVKRHFVIFVIEKSRRLGVRNPRIKIPIRFH